MVTRWKHCQSASGCRCEHLELAGPRIAIEGSPPVMKSRDAVLRCRFRCRFSVDQRSRPNSACLPLRSARENTRETRRDEVDKIKVSLRLFFPRNMSDTDAEWIFYGYTGSKAAAVVMAVAFGVALIGHTFLTFRSKAFYVRPTSFSR